VLLLQYSGGIQFYTTAFKASQKEAYADLGIMWHTDMLPHHFTTDAARVYQYQPRVRKYMIKKARYKGHQRPLVWSGESMQMLMAARRVTSTAKGVRVSMLGPKHWYQYRIDLLQPDKTDEVTRTTADEEQRMQRAFDETVTKRTTEIAEVQARSAPPRDSFGRFIGS